MLERLYVDNYKCLVNFDCRFGRSQLVLGPNGSGKTTLFEVVASVRDFCVWGLEQSLAFGGTTRTRWQNVPEQTFELDVAGNEGTYNFQLVIDTWGHPSRPRVVKEELYFSGKPIFRFAQGQVHLFNDRHEDQVQYPFNWHRSALATVTEGPENTKLSWFKRWLGALLFISPDPRQMLNIAERESPAPTRNLSNFASWYRHLRQEQARRDQLFIDDLRQAIPGLQELDLKDAGMGNRFLWLNFSVNGDSGHPQSFGQFFTELSDGQRILVALYAVLNFAIMQGATVFLDEPDNYVALPEIQPWLDKLLDAVDDESLGAQAVIISHHPELLNRLANQGGLALERPGGRHTRAHMFQDPAQTGLPPAELIARGWDHE